jgi:hypothetical protein
MEHIDPATLDALLKASGVSKKTADKLRTANAAAAEGDTKPPSPGHGAARPAVIQVADL